MRKIQRAWIVGAMKCKFVIPEGLGPNKERRRIPRASDVIVASGVPIDVPPPARLLNRLGNPDLVMAFDVETHDWRDNAPNRGRVGRFTWYTLKDEADIHYGRIVQLGWVIGPTDSIIPADAKTVLVKPTEDFEVSSKAATFHKISHERAVQEGRPLEDTLRDFMNDVVCVYERGGRVVAHQDRKLLNWFDGRALCVHSIRTGSTPGPQKAPNSHELSPSVHITDPACKR